MNLIAVKVIALCVVLYALVGWDLLTRPWLMSLVPDLSDAHEVES